MRRRRKKALLWLLVMLAANLLCLVFLHCRLRPLMLELAKAKVSNTASYLINEAVQEQLQSGEIAYDKMIFFEKDLNGDIKALQTNIAETNRLKAQTLSLIDNMLLKMDVREMGVPLGNLILPEFFAGSGPKLPVRIITISSSDADFRSVLSEAGINQISHQIIMDVRLTMTILTPAGTETVQAETSVLTAETLLVGKVPQGYVNVK